MIRALTALFALAASVSGLAPAPQEPKPSTEPAAAGKGLPEALKAWPALAAADRDRAISLTGQFKKDEAAVKEAARKELLAMGAGAAPVLFQKVGDAEKELALNEELYLVFDEMLQAEHRNLMAEQAKKKKLELRKYLVRRLCQIADPELKDDLAPFAKDADEQIAFHANLGLAALGDTEALAAVVETTRTKWADHKPMVEKVLPRARSAAAGTAVADYVAKKPPAVQAAGLRILRYVATDETRATIKAYLTSEDHNLKKEAVNALRVMAGQEALENLSAFEAIGMAKEWLNK